MTARDLWPQWLDLAVQALGWTVIGLTWLAAGLITYALLRRR